MKYAYLFAIVMAMALLAGCNQPDNGEIPPPGELPTPYPTQSAKTPPPATSASSRPASDDTAPTTSASTH